MAKTIANLLQEVIKRSTATVDISAAETLQDEITTEDFEAVLGNLYNIETAEAALRPKIANVIKAEALNGVDAQILEILCDGLSAEEIKSIKEETNTAAKMRKVREIYNAKSSIQAATNEPEQVKALTKALEEANAKIRANEAAKNEEFATIEANHKAELYKFRLENMINGRDDIAADKKDGRHFTPNFVSDLSELLAKEGVTVDHGTLELKKEDGTPYFTAIGEKASLHDMIGRVVLEYGYEKKSVTPERVTIEVGGEGPGQFKTVQDRMEAARRTTQVSAS